MIKFKDEWLVQALIKSRLISEQEITKIRQDSRENTDVYLSEKLLSMGYINQTDLAKILEHLFQIPFINLDDQKINKAVTEIIPEEVCRKYEVFPYRVDDDYITIAIFDPMNLDAEREVGFLAARLVKTTLSTKKQIEEMKQLIASAKELMRALKARKQVEKES